MSLKINKVFFDVFLAIEGEDKIPVDEDILISNLIKTGKFTKDESNNCIRAMLRNVSIYESKPYHYNSIW